VILLWSHDNANVGEPHRHLQLALGIRDAHVVRAGTQGADELQTLLCVWSGGAGGTLYAMPAIQGRRVRALLSRLEADRDVQAVPVIFFDQRVEVVCRACLLGTLKGAHKTLSPYRAGVRLTRFNELSCSSPV
jgi:hypothetical protein